MAEPSTLTQMAINMANTDFIRRVTPHPQVASPLQQLITEDQQAKGDPGDDEIEGLDAEVLLNANTLEDGEAVMLDFEGQGETPSSQLQGPNPAPDPTPPEPPDPAPPPRARLPPTQQLTPPHPADPPTQLELHIQHTPRHPQPA